LGVSPDVYHLNEGHMAFAGLAVALQYQKTAGGILADALAAVRLKIVATKHTILHGAGITLDRSLLEKYLSETLESAEGSVDDLMALGGKPDGYLSTTKLVLAEAVRRSGVAKIHVRAEAKEHSDSDLIAITNGIFMPRWRAANWVKDLSSRELQSRHHDNKQQLVEHAAQFGIRLDPDRLTVVWARRMTAYKRPEMLVTDLERLAELAHNSKRPIQFIVSGQANPSDEAGVNLMNEVIAASKDERLQGNFAYLPFYNPASARLLVQGADVWLNTPIRGQEACGTSGMKASLNGALQLSTSDGWFDEVDQEPIGWILPEDATAATLYDILEREVAPMFYDDKASWEAKMRNNIALIEQQFSAERMLKDYFSHLYFPPE
jgi:starch phosphorylase